MNSDGEWKKTPLLANLLVVPVGRAHVVAPKHDVRNLLYVTQASTFTAATPGTPNPRRHSVRSGRNL
jgi:hypothetical protein